MTAELVLERSGGDGYACFRIPCLVRTDAGTILACYECRKSRDDWAEIDLGLRRSTDGGKSFSARKILVRGEGKTLNNPVLFADRSRIVLLWQQEYRRTFCCVSTDEGQRFSAPRELTAFTDDGACTVLASILLDNAARYASDGADIVFRLEKQKKGILIGTENRWDSDRQGPCDELFDRFYRADPARTGGGFGIGLSIVRSIAQAHRGAVHAVAADGILRITAVLP